MSDPSYNQVSSAVDQDLSEEVITGAFGVETLYCKRGCCGDNKYPACCVPDDDIGQSQFKEYKLLTIIAASVGGVAIIAVVIIAVVKWQLKKRRLIRDIQAINSMNRMTDLNTKVKVIGGGTGSADSAGGSKKDKKNKEKDSEKKKKKFFKSSKKASLVQVSAFTTSPNSPEVPPLSYTALDMQDCLNTESATRAVGNLPVYLPTIPTLNSGLQTSAAAETTALSAGVANYPLSPLVTASKSPRAEVNLTNISATPLTESPAFLSRSYNKEQTTIPSATISSVSSFSSKEGSEKNSSSSSSGVSSSSSLPQILYDDDDLALYFPEFQYK
ncbi:hypothetical protein PoB_004090600 [Plakobranchus ocellatus]|uniref:CX domain-containing protein n=1 Tax=Plakobranchus ocellatus TaxID=259542 RepID=A0AAV4B6H2_9GAST|nr:hypothetical protein PoB_004090600 [Plakobranchus ocellatus]